MLFIRHEQCNEPFALRKGLAVDLKQGKDQAGTCRSAMKRQSMAHPTRSGPEAMTHSRADSGLRSSGSSL
jgi:hypothetical protein